MEEEGIVVAVDGDVAKIKVKRHSDCENCGGCPGNNAMVMEVLNPVKAQVNQRVYFRIQERGMLKAAFIVFILPLLTGAIGYWGFVTGAHYLTLNVLWSGILGFVIGFGIAVFYIRRYDRQARSKGVMPVITRIIGEQ